MLKQRIHADRRTNGDGEPLLLIEEVVRKVVMRVSRFGKVDHATGEVDEPQSLLAIVRNVREVNPDAESECVFAESCAVSDTRAYRISERHSRHVLFLDGYCAVQIQLERPLHV